MSTQLVEEVPRIFTVKTFAARHSGFLTENSLRFQIHKSQENGLAACGAIIRMGGRVLINEQRYLGWLDAQSQVPTAGCD